MIIPALQTTFNKNPFKYETKDALKHNAIIKAIKEELYYNDVYAIQIKRPKGKHLNKYSKYARLSLAEDHIPFFK